jgi:hypothetical protein
MPAGLTWGDPDERLTRIAAAALAAVPGDPAAVGGEGSICLIRSPLPVAFGGRGWRTGVAVAGITDPEDALDLLLAEVKSVARACMLSVNVALRGKVGKVRMTFDDPNDRLTSLAGVALAAIEAHPDSRDGDQVVAAVRSRPEIRPARQDKELAGLAIGITLPLRRRVSYQGGVGTGGFGRDQRAAVDFMTGEAERLAAAYRIPFRAGADGLPADVN